MGKNNVLIFPCGSEVAFEVHQALKYNVNFKVFGASSIDDHGKYVFKNYIGGLPYIQKDDFIKRFNEILLTNQIDIVFPTHDTVSVFLAENREIIKAKIAVPDLKTARICRNKKLTYELFKNYDFNPKVLDWECSQNDFPLFLKPIIGEGGKNTMKVNNIKELDCFKGNKEDFLLLEYLEGDELTVDCFTDRHSVLRFVGPRARNRVFGGISVNSKTEHLDAELKKIAETINVKLNLRGLWFFQVKKNKEGKYKLLEVSVRTSSTMGLYRNLGLNFHLLTAYDILDFDVELINNNYSIEIDRAFINRFSTPLKFDTVYIDFDDTITRDGEVNEFVMPFIYQQVRKNRKLILITRHEHDIYETLRTLKIDTAIFDEIIHLTNDQSKAAAIKITNNCIFIDNAYQERKEVKQKLNIPVFDVDAIQSLVDYRE